MIASPDPSTVGEPDGLTWRPVREDDHAAVLAAVQSWWDDGRGVELAGLLPRLFFQHFGSTSLVVHDGEVLAAFLIGFLSATRGEQAYVHFVGVDPARQGAGLGRTLYERFFDLARRDGRTSVHAITGVANTRSQAFHRRLGFSPSAPQPDYDGPGLDRVAMVARLDARR